MAPQKIRKAVFPAAGLGTRFLPATKAMPKEMLRLVDKPLIQYGVEEAVAAGCTEIIIVTGRGKSTMEDHFDIVPELEANLEPADKTALLEIARSVSKLAQDHLHAPGGSPRPRPCCAAGQGARRQRALRRPPPR